MEQSNGSASSHPADAPARPTDENGPPVSPPYWQARVRGDSTLSIPSSSTSVNHINTSSSNSRKNRLSGPIRLFDNSEEESSDQARACWAKSARVDDYVIVSGSVSKAGLGSYVVWSCTVETLNVRPKCLAHDLRPCSYVHMHLDRVDRIVELTGAYHRVGRSRSAKDTRTSIR